MIGKLPSFLSYFQDLRILNIRHNDLHGGIPQSITNLSKLYMLDLSNNKFNGTIPYHLERLSGFATSQKNHSSNYALYEEMTIGMKGMEARLSYELSTNTIFDLSSNNLTGEIPATIGRMSSLRLLN